MYLKLLEHYYHIICVNNIIDLDNNYTLILAFISVTILNNYIVNALIVTDRKEPIIKHWRKNEWSLYIT